MSEHYEELIGGALDEFRYAEALEGAPTGGSAAVRAKVAHRRRVRITTYSVLGALLIALPVAAFAANPRGNNSPPADVLETPTPAPVVTTPPPHSPLPEVKDGRFTVEELLGAPAPTFDEPACGKKIVAKPAPGVESKVFAKEVAHANLDSDPQLETAALLVCTTDDESTRVAAYDRDAEGKVVMLGVVVGMLGERGMHDVIGIKPRTAGGIIATVHYSTYSPEPGEPDPQEREYAWNGSKFTQVGGPTTFAPAKTDLSLTASPLRLGPAQNGKRTGTVTLTLTGSGPDDSHSIDIELSTGHRITIEGHPGNVIKHGPVKAEETRTITLTVTIEVGSGQSPLSIGAGITSYANDSNRDNNFVTIEVTE
ncbi:hypothetical protein [Allorhizocola rhizosphaerae]|uniref:hypothetical protein n=1 Tax=Allorhizocola rhizosphaerae TaxID=1872709 RepID=UPI000E3E1BB5|nr:hypothetical protein [Allorhizocola rhizosphaerae]